VGKYTRALTFSNPSIPVCALLKGLSLFPCLFEYPWILIKLKTLMRIVRSMQDLLELDLPTMADGRMITPDRA
jgi:hypothetical protein